MKKKILVISGGISKEREISLQTGNQVSKELKKYYNYADEKDQRRSKCQVGNTVIDTSIGDAKQYA